MAGREATVLIVPGLRDAVPQHWQTLLASRLPRVRTVAPMGRHNLDCLQRVEAIEEAAASIDGPIILVAHSGGVVATLHWARLTQRELRGALLQHRRISIGRCRKAIPRWRRLTPAAGCRCRAIRCRSEASWRRAAMIRWPATNGPSDLRDPGAADWSTLVRSDTSIPRPVTATGQQPTASSPSWTRLLLRAG